MERIQQNGLQYYRSEQWTHLPHGIFTRHGGVSEAPYGTLNTGGTVGDDVEAVRHNHTLMYDTLGVNADRACTTWQVHGADVVMATGPVEGRRWVAKADGIITDTPETPLVMRFADCVPLLFHDPVKRVIGLGHAGWRGTVRGMGASMVQAMQQGYGCQPQDIQVVIGPSISQQAFQVGEEVVEAVEQRYGTLDGLMQRDPADGTAYVDLWEANRRDLRRAGVVDEHIETAGICTHTNTDDFYSHRAENGNTGRFGVVMSL